MIAIETRIIPCTDHKPTRIVAETANGQRLVMSLSAAETMALDAGLPDRDDNSHRVCAQALATKMQWGILGDGGSTRRGMVFCFREKV